MKGKIKWNTPRNPQSDIVRHGDIRIINFPVKVLIEWSDKIIADYDSESGETLEYVSGHIAKVLPNQQFVYQGEKSIYFAQAQKKK